jgi:hypothetical protein
VFRPDSGGGYGTARALVEIHRTGRVLLFVNNASIFIK